MLTNTPSVKKKGTFGMIRELMVDPSVYKL